MLKIVAPGNEHQLMVCDEQHCLAIVKRLVVNQDVKYSDNLLVYLCEVVSRVSVKSGAIR